VVDLDLRGMGLLLTPGSPPLAAEMGGAAGPFH
jgi:hypothetical protein